MAVTRVLAGFRLDVRLALPAGVLVLFGPSGSGKTMTLDMVAGIVRPSSGRIVIAGQTVFDSAAGIDVPPQSRRVGYVMQDYALFPHMTVAQNVAFGLHSLPRTERRALVVQVCDTVRLNELMGRRPSQLSGGQKQRVALARALAFRPRLLLLDEPLAALEYQLRTELRSELVNLAVEMGVPSLFVTHDRDEARRVSTHAVVYEPGRPVRMVATHDL
jgi:molybdate transport system ATP-binding protein